MAFIKIKNKKAKEDTIINTDMICRISKNKTGYIVYFSSGNTGAAYYEYDEFWVLVLLLCQAFC